MQSNSFFFTVTCFILIFFTLFTISADTDQINAAINRMNKRAESQTKLALTFDKDALKSFIDDKIIEYKDLLEKAIKEKEKGKSGIAWANGFLFVGGGGGGLLAVISAFIPEETMPKSVGGISGIVSVACVFFPGVFGLNKDELVSMNAYYSKFIKTLDIWIAEFTKYSLELINYKPANEIDKIKNAVYDAQVEIDSLNPLYN